MHLECCRLMPAWVGGWAMFSALKMSPRTLRSVTGPPRACGGPVMKARSTAEKIPQDAALLLLSLATGEALRGFLRRLDHDEALPGEAHRESLTGAAAEQRADAQLVGAVIPGLQARGPADGGLRVDVGGRV